MLNMDFDQTVIINTQQQTWVNSPAKGVMRKPLARAKAEQGHATSIVQYQAGTCFKPHQHPQGEEILVLEGIFSDENGDYPAGTYIRNPDGSQHAPFSKTGCVVFVKLCQFQAGDNKQLSIQTQDANWQQAADGFQILPLHTYRSEKTSLIKWPKGQCYPVTENNPSQELLIIQGKLNQYSQLSWLRSPRNLSAQLVAQQDSLVLIKQGHLISSR